MKDSKNKVVARLTITRADNQKLIIEVHSNATFSNFYQYYRQTGNRRSTKTFIHVRSRNEGLRYINAHRQIPGLEVLAERITSSNKVFYGQDGKAKERNPVTSIKLRIIRKREYKKLLNAAPTGMAIVRDVFPVRNPSVGILLLLPTRRVSEQVGG